MVMKVKELIEFLKTQNQDLDVAYECYSEQELLKKEDIKIFEGCIERQDGWIQNKRSDIATKLYLLFPGN